jgi:tetratricopeptide (TPR) repeat protein
MTAKHFEDEIDDAEKLRATGDLTTCLRVTQELLAHAEDDDHRMRLLFDIVTCASQLDLQEITDNAIRELEKFPDPDFSRALANLDRGNGENQLGRPENAIAFYELILATGYFERDDFRIHRYQLCLYKGQALAKLRRTVEAVEWLDKAHWLYPTENTTRNEDERLIFNWAEPLIQVERANCLMAGERFDEAFQASAEVLKRTDGDLATFARQ